MRFLGRATAFTTPHMRTRTRMLMRIPPPPRLFSQRRQQSSPKSQSSTSQPSPSQPSSSFYAFFPRTLPRGPPPHGSFRINPRALRAEFLALQAKHHPDKHLYQQQQQKQQQQQQAHPQAPPPDEAPPPDQEALSASINEAYRTLLDPLLRAEYLLSLYQGQAPPGSAGAESARIDPADEADLLALVMETREAIEQATSRAEVNALRLDNEERVKESERVLEAAFASGVLDMARREAVRLKYWVNIREAIQEWEEERTEGDIALFGF
ncbi:hypothetical protein E4U41_002987 [Claviceps citrina]|nr:hypothetical protein E4U41_002987 [Claviceps citrina]